MIRKLVIVLLSGAICLLGVTSVLAQSQYQYTTLAEYEKATGKTITKFNEAPMLRTLVAAGELPPVEERLPEEPMVVVPLEEIGQYGGTLKTISASPLTNAADLAAIVSEGLRKWTPDLKTLAPNIAKGWDLSKDMKTLIIYLRKGMKWSDGAPFTADDFVFWYKDILLNKELTPVIGKTWCPGGQVIKVEKVDDYTVRVKSAIPNPSMPLRDIGFAPKHYLKRYHIKYNPKATELAKQNGYDKWWMLFNYYYSPGTNKVRRIVDYPTLGPWVLKKVTSTRYLYERNPYYWKVDTAGNQLPYIDKASRVDVENREVAEMKIIAGEFDIAGFDLLLSNYPLYKKNEKKGNYHTMLWKSPLGSRYYFAFNYTHKDPILRKIFRDLRFRQAMSIAINRQEINKVLFFGKAVPRQATLLPNVSFYEPWMGKYYTQYDPKEANRLLDEMGLKWDKEHKFRLRPDGKTLALTIEYVQIEGPKRQISELIKDYWEDVGVKVTLKEEERNYYQQRGLANEGEVRAWHLPGAEVTNYLFNICRFCAPWHNPAVSAGGIEWWNWWNTGGKTGEEPPEEIKKQFKAIDKWQHTVMGSKEYIRLGKEILTRNVKNLWTIGTVGMDPLPIIIKNNLRNTPKTGMFASDYDFFGPYRAEQWFFQD